MGKWTEKKGAGNVQEEKWENQELLKHPSVWKQISYTVIQMMRQEEENSLFSYLIFQCFYFVSSTSVPILFAYFLHSILI